MTAVPVRIFLCLFILSVSGFLSTIQASAFSDTTLLLSSIKHASLPSSIIISERPSNVIYPVNLQNHRAQTIGYIEKFSSRKRSYLMNTYRKGKIYFPKVTAMLKRYQLPQELKVLVALESGFNANAVSRAGAVGYWQIMDDVGKEYGLQIVKASDKASSKKKDERKNFSKSTLVAVKYLRDRCRNLNSDLLLMVAAYNCGVGNVWDAMKKSGKTNANFWDIKKYLPAETRSYVMNFVTLNVIFANYDKFAKQQLVFNSIPPQEILINNTSPVVSPEPCTDL